MSAKKLQLNNNENNLVVFFYLTLPLLLLPAFFRGLFFAYEADVAHIYTALVLGAYFITRKDYIRPSRNIMDYAWAGLILAYIISNFVAFNRRDAVESALAIFNFFAVYWLLAQTTSTGRDYKTAFTVMNLAGLGVALAGLGTAFGTFTFNGAYDSGLILSTLQYHNATAIFLVACSIIGFYLTVALNGFWLRIVSCGVNYIIIITAFGAGSRGAMLVAPVVFVLLIAGLPKDYRFKIFLNMLAVLVPFFLTAKQVLSFGQHSQGYHWAWLVLGLVVALGCQLVVEKFLTFAAHTRRKVVMSAGIAVAVAAVGLVLFMGSRVMPTTIAERLSYVSLKDVNVMHRFFYYQDALQIIRDYPVFGTGGGGWNALYPAYQKFMYYSTEVHSHPLRLWVETGTFGFFFYVLFWVGFAVTVFRLMKKVASPEYRAIGWTAAVAAISIFLHSMIDFSLSLGSVAILMYGLAGLLRSTDRVGTGEDRLKSKPVAGPLVRKIAGVSLAVVFLMISSSLYYGALQEKKATNAYNSGDVQGAMEAFQAAAKYDPFNHFYPMYLAGLDNELAYQKKNLSFAITGLEHAKQAVKLSPKTPDTSIQLAQSYLLCGNPDQAVATIKQLVTNAPWRNESYANVARISLAAADQYIRLNQKEEARKVLTEIVDLPTVIANQVKSGIADRNVWFRGFLEVNANLQQYIDQANKKLKAL